MKNEILSVSAEETKEWGARLARLLVAQSVIGLEGELGAGKTCFVKGLASGLGIDEDEIHSPTFTLIAEHYRGKLPLYHIDLYRLGNTEIEELGIEEYLFEQGVAAVEWFQFLPPGFVEEYLLISFACGAEDERILTLTGHGKKYEQIVSDLISGTAEDGVRN